MTAPAVERPARTAAAGAAPSTLERDDASWDAFVAGSGMPTHLQSTAWAAIKGANGWEAIRVATAASGSSVGGQILVRRAPPLPYGLGYLPRGPVAHGSLDGPAIAAFTERLRGIARARRVALVRMEPELEGGSGAEQDLEAAGWRPTGHVQPDSTRIIDLDRPEEDVWGDLHRKCRQSVTKSERMGVRVVEADGGRLGDFYRIHVDAMLRAGIATRTAATYRRMWQELAPRGMAHLLFAEASATGEAVATLFLVSCGPRVVDLYGGTTAEGARTRANYLLKWDAIRRCRAWGYREYDLWGLPREGIARFKSSFGGREIRYVGAWQLEVDRVGAISLRAGEAARDRYRRLRHPGHRPEADGE